MEHHVNKDGGIEQNQDVKRFAVEVAQITAIPEESKSLHRHADRDGAGDDQVRSNAWAKGKKSVSNVDEVRTEDRHQIAGQILAMGGDIKEFREGL